LSRAQATRPLNTKFGSPILWRGQQVGCYDCHNGPDNSDSPGNTPPVVSNVSTNTLNGATVAMTLPGASTKPLTFRVVSQPAHGTMGVKSNVATYFADPGYVGTDGFTFAANDGFSDSNLGSGTVNVTQGPFSLAAAAHVPSNWPAGWPAPFAAIATPSNTAATITYDWDFGDGTAHSTNPYASHAYATPGAYPWAMVARVGSAQATVTGSITITGSMSLTAAHAGAFVTLTWPRTDADAVLEQTPVVPVLLWKPSTNAVVAAPMTYQVEAANIGNEFYRLRLVR
ncbi:MAG: PKD domain-containing protein, partial [Verrucomicrobia bacterium]|nr:PKD domain-containing protein [Verrucomicrobiota bacterium]